MFQKYLSPSQTHTTSAPDETPRQSLRRTTDAAHRRLHDVPGFAALLQGRLSLGDYRLLLLRVLGLHAPLDEWLGRFQHDPLLAWAYAQPEDSRAARLRRDLAALGTPDGVINAVPRAERVLPQAATSAGALGCAWVVEGSALGGRVMAKLLHRHLGVTPDTGGSFFAPQPQQETRWAACCEAVETCGGDALARIHMQEAARATMNAFADWMEEAVAA